MDAVDLAYIDPPYNQHPYGSNYFMLNLINGYVRPLEISPVSGIPVDWNRSSYNKRNLASKAFMEMIYVIKAKYLLVSYNSEGFFVDEMLTMLRDVGSVEMTETQYNAFRGSRNLRNRSIHTKEYLFLVSKEGLH